ncbi:hypothetical protein chiPu_0010654 [Chiloscyllium punctatum]|uniref:Uncharacterized protein n=1 Tax=Chiloscyllium punctatum TaxID=137246 RepID=A0A401SP71_CHIPU|nr:hypothetical protein [Chiloscyllium punctatum]
MIPGWVLAGVPGLHCIACRALDAGLHFESLKQIPNEVSEHVKLLDTEEVDLDQSNMMNTKSDNCKRSRNLKKIQISPNEKKEQFERAVIHLTEGVTEGNRESSPKKKHKKNKKSKEKSKSKEKCSQKKELQKLEKLWQQWTPKPLPESTASAKVRKKKCHLKDRTSVRVSDANHLGMKHKEQEEEDKATETVNDLQVKNKMACKYLCLPASQENVCSSVDDKEKQQDEGTHRHWEEASCIKMIAQETSRKGGLPGSLHYGSRNPFRLSCANTSTPTIPVDASLLTHLRCLKSSPSNPTRVHENSEPICLKTSKDDQVMKTSPELIEDFGNSQDLFITQKKFLPFVQSNSNSSYSVEEMASEECAEQLRSLDGRQLRFCSPPHTKVIDLCCSGLKSPKSRSAEKGTQTDDFFSSPAFATSVLFCQKLKKEQSFEEPLDLSLPSRLRTKNSTDLKNILNASYIQENSINPSYQHIALPLSSPEGQHACQLLRFLPYSDGKKHNRRYYDGKFVQTFLNQSYFFKVKGQGKPKNPRMPLLKKNGKKQRN